MDERMRRPLPPIRTTPVNLPPNADQIALGMAQMNAGEGILPPSPEEERPRPVDKERLLDFDRILNKYKAGKNRLESRVTASENWWKLRNETEEKREGSIGWDQTFRAKTGWLHNVIVSKHADAMENYPEPIILPREPGDRQQADTLSKVLPVILERNRFEQVYSDNWWQKLKTGTAVYQVGWDGSKLNGLGDISIKRADLLSVFWAPGVTDIQDSPYFFHCEMRDNKELETEFPQLKGKLRGSRTVLKKYQTDDPVDTSEKSLVVDVYYKVRENGREVLHYCQYVGDEILASTENEGRGGLYAHGKYPFVFDALWPIEGSPCGYGYVDLCKNSQTQIDMMDTAITKNTMVGATPRYFQRVDGGINEAEFNDLQKAIVHVSGGSLDENVLRIIDWKPLGGAYVNVYNNKIAELRETSGNTETASGVAPSGVTAASAIAALQEASGKTSRDSTQASYRTFSELIEMCVELVRQFYDLPRTFRIIGQHGEEQFTELSNEQMKPRPVFIGEQHIGDVEPLFDIKIKAQKRNAYSRTAQNELALQLYGQGFFNPELTDQALACLDMMDFEGKEDVMQKIIRNGTLFDKLMQAQQLVLTLLQKYEPQNVAPIAQAMGMNVPQMPMQGSAAPANLQNIPAESGVTANARARAARTTEVNR